MTRGSKFLHIHLHVVSTGHAAKRKLIYSENFLLISPRICTIWTQAVFNVRRRMRYSQLLSGVILIVTSYLRTAYFNYHISAAHSLHLNWWTGLYTSYYANCITFNTLSIRPNPEQWNQYSLYLTSEICHQKRLTVSFTLSWTPIAGLPYKSA